MRTPHCRDAGRRRRGAFRLAILAVLAACAGGTSALAAPDDFSGQAWIGWARGSSYVSPQMYDFRPDGTFIVRYGMNSEERGSWSRAGDGVVMQTNEGFVVYQATITDGRLVGTWRVSNDAETGQFDLEPDAACAAERAMCRRKSFCVDPQRRQSLRPIPALTDAFAQQDDSFASFYDAFACVVDLGLIEDYAARIRFPLDVDIISFDAQQTTARHSRQSVGREGFDADMIAGAGGEDRPEQTIDPVFASRDGEPPSNRVVRISELRLRSRLTAWTFRQDPESLRWSLTASASCPGYDGSTCLRQLLCPSHPTAYPPPPADGREDFAAFYRTFYCTREPDLVTARMRFPLPYTQRHTEGEGEGVFETREQLDFNIFAGDMPETSTDGDLASVFLDTDSGWSIGQKFSRIDGLWYLTGLDIGNY